MLKTVILSILVGLAVADHHPHPHPHHPIDCSGLGCTSDGGLPSTFPHDYYGIPNRHYHYDHHNHREWQRYYHVDSEALPNRTQCRMPNSYAGNIPVKREGHPNNTLFFWGIEKHTGSLTREYEHHEEHDKNPWILWLNGGPGSSSLIGLFFEHGPCLIRPDYSLVPNPHSLNKLVDVIYLDQPVGTGYSTADAKGYIPNEDVMGDDVIGFLENLVTVFPNLRSRPVYIVGESYAGKYIPYIAKRYFAREPHHRPVRLGGISMADGVLSDDGSLSAGMVQAIETYPQLINYDPDKGGPFPTLRLPLLKTGGQTFNTYLTPKLRSHALFRDKKSALHTIMKDVADNHEEKKAQFHFEISQQQDNNNNDNRAAALSKWKTERGLPGRGNGVIDPYYECDLYAELVDWAVNFTEPWSTQHDPKAGVDPYDIPDATSPEPPQDASPMLNDFRTVKAIHAPQSKCWRETFACQFTYPFGSNVNAPQVPDTNQWGDPSLATTIFLSELFHNISQINGTVTLAEGNDDLIITARTMILAIQNVTFEGIQGFSKEPQVSWYGEDGTPAGVVHQERGVKYVLFSAAGHLLAAWQSSRYLTFVKEFVLGNNRNGSIGSDGQLIGVKQELFNGYNLPGARNHIFTGSGATQGSTVWPTATIDAWESFIRTASAPIGTETETETETYDKHEEL